MRIDGAKEDITGQGLTTLVLPGNRVAFFDHGRVQFVFFDSTGNRVGAPFGRAGEGPGEWGSPTGRTYSLRVGLIGDTMWVYSTRQRRYTLIGPDMKLVRTFLQPPTIAPVAVYNPRTALDGERVLARADYGDRVPITLPDGRASTTWKPVDSGFAVLAKDGSVERRIAPVPPGGSSAMIVRPTQPIGRTAMIPFGHSNLFAHSPNGDRMAIATMSATGTTGTLTVTVIRTNGEQVYKKSFPYTAEPIASRMRDSALARADSGINRGSNPEENAELRTMIRERMPTTVGAFREMDLGADGTAWIRKTGPNEGPDEYLVIDANGTQLPDVRLPRKNMRLLTGTRASIWAIETDADGFVSVLRFVPVK